MRKKEYSENDEIEISLSHYVKDCYLLVWRFKEPRKWWFFKKYDKWKVLHLYRPSAFMTKEDDPDDSFYWDYVKFNLGKNHKVQEYEKVKSTVKTKKDLYDYFKVEYSMESYRHQLEEYTKWRMETDNTVERLTNNK